MQEFITDIKESVKNISNLEGLCIMGALVMGIACIFIGALLLY